MVCVRQCIACQALAWGTTASMHTQGCGRQAGAGRAAPFLFSKQVTSLCYCSPIFVRLAATPTFCQGQAAVHHCCAALVAQASAYHHIPPGAARGGLLQHKGVAPACTHNEGFRKLSPGLGPAVQVSVLLCGGYCKRCRYLIFARWFGVAPGWRLHSLTQACARSAGSLGL